MATPPFDGEETERPPAHDAVSGDDVDAAAEQYRADTDGIREAFSCVRDTVDIEELAREYDWTSRADNYFVTTEDLWLSFVTPEDL
jgi:hypothetical protein